MLATSFSNRDDFLGEQVPMDPAVLNLGDFLGEQVSMDPAVLNLSDFLGELRTGLVALTLRDFLSEWRMGPALFNCPNVFLKCDVL